MDIQDQNKQDQQVEDPFIVHPVQVKGSHLQSLNARDIFYSISHKLKDHYKDTEKSQSIQIVKVKIHDPKQKNNPQNFNNQLENTINFIKNSSSFNQQKEYNIYSSQSDQFLNELFKDAMLIKKDFNEDDNQHLIQLCQQKFRLTEQENDLFKQIQEFINNFSSLCKKYEEFENLDSEQQKVIVKNFNDVVNNPKNLLIPNTLRQIKDDKKQLVRQFAQNQIELGDKLEKESIQRRNIFADIIGKQSIITELKQQCENNHFKIKDPLFEKDYSGLYNDTPIMFFNFQNKQQYPITHSEDLVEKIIKEELEVLNWSLGYLQGPKNQEEFIRYFSTSGFQEVLSKSDAFFTLKSSMIFYPKIKNKSKKIEIISQLFNNYELKLEFSIKYIQDCSLIHDEGSKKWSFFFRLLTPPKFYINQIDPVLYNNPQFYNKEWVRLPNFTIVDQDGIDEFARLHFINNTILNIDIQEYKENLDPMLQLRRDLEEFKLWQDQKNLYIKKKKDDLKIYNHKKFNLFQNFQQFSMIHLDFELKYLIMVAICQNKLSTLDDQEVQGQVASNIPNIFNYIASLQQQYQQDEQEQCKNMIKQALITTIKIMKPQLNSTFFQYFKYFCIKVKEQKKYNIDQIDLNQYQHISFITRIQFTPSGLLYNLKEPEMDNRLLRQFSDLKEFFLRCHFVDDDHSYPRNMKYVTSKYFRKQLDSLVIIDRKYSVLAWSSSQIKSASCWCYYESPDNRLKKNLIKEMGDFQNIKIAAKKSARIGQCLSSSIPINFTAQIQINLENDVVSQKDNKKVFSDGIGKISKNLIDEIQIKLRKVKLSAIQMRLKGAKGVLSLEPSLPDNTIILRASQIKYESNYPDLEILDTNKYRAGYLNRQVIILLLSLKVNPANFQELQDINLKQLEQISLKDSSIYKYFNAEYNGDIVNLSPITKILRQLLKFNMDFENDPFVTGVMKTLKSRAYYTLRKKSNILVEKSARLIGVLDEYGVLEEDEIYCSIQEDDKEKFEVEGKVMITKNPCLHCGDIRVVRAVTSQILEQRNGGSNQLDHFVNTVVFPQKGDVPITSQISGGDLDGDLFFITWDERLIPPMTIEAFDYTPPKQIDEKDQIGESDMLDFFVDYMNFENLGKIDNSHLAKADQSEELALDPDCVKLAEYHSAAVDFAKTGYCPKIESKYFAKKYPDFMERKTKDTNYPSETILGVLYRQVKDIVNNQKVLAIENKNQNLDKIKIEPNFIFLNPSSTDKTQEQEIDQSVKILQKYCEDMYSEQSYFGFLNEFEVYTGNFSKFIKEHKQKRSNKEQDQKRILSRIIQLKKYYEAIFFKNMELDQENFNNQKGKFTNKAKFRSTLWYLVSYLYSYPINHIINFDQMDYEKQQLIQQIYNNTFFKQLLDKKAQKNEKFIGLAWFIVPDVLLQIRNEYYLNEANGVQNINEEEKQVDEDENIYI